MIHDFSEDELTQMFGGGWSNSWRKKGGAEIFARLGQVANWFGITDITKQPLTGNMLKYAAGKGRYIKDANFDNQMTEFFNILKENNSWESAAKAFNKYGKVLILPIAGYGGYTTGNKVISKNKQQSQEVQ